MIGDPDHPAHMPEEYHVHIGFHRDGTVCVQVDSPDGRTDEEAREVLAMVGELSEIADVVGVTASGHLVTQVRREL